MINYKKLTVAFMVGTLSLFTLTGCTMPWDKKAETSITDTSSTDSSNVEKTLESVAETDLTLEFDDEDLNSQWNESDCTKITLSDQNTQISGSGASVSSSDITITASGTYLISGKLSEGSININVADKKTVRLILNGADISNSTKSPFTVETAKKVIVTLADGTTNTFTDSARTTTEAEDYSAAISSKADLIFNGNGNMTVNAGYRNGIKSSDDLKIVSGDFKITSKEDGIVGKDLLGIKNGNFDINAGCDGMKSTYDTDTAKGNVILLDGTYQIKSGNDGIQSENSLLISAGNYTIETANGAIESTKSDNNSFGQKGNMFNPNAATQTQTQSQTETQTTDDTTSDSYKGVKAGNSMYINGGTFVLNCQDDGIHSNNNILIKNGDITIKTGDDGIHADQSLQIDNGKIAVEQSYEGLESTTIQINGGEISIVASDDGMNASSGSTVSNTGFNMNGGMKGGFDKSNGGQADQGNQQMPNQNQQMPDGSQQTPNGNQQTPDGSQQTPNGNQQMPNDAQQNNADSNMGNTGNNGNAGNTTSGTAGTSVTLEINGGNIFVNANGDGLDANGAITINGGNTVVCGPTSDGDTAIDFDSACTLNGGTLMAFGSSGMLETPTSAQNGACIIAGFTSVTANTNFTLTDADGKNLMSYTPVKAYTCAILYSSDIKTGNSYTLTADGQSQTIEVKDAITSNVTSSMGGGMNGKGGMQRPNQNGNQGNMQMPDQSGNQGNMQMPDQNGNQGNMQMPDQSGNQGNMQMPDQSGNQGNMQMPNQNSSQSNNSF